MTADELQADRNWLAHYAPHLNTLGLDVRNAVRTADYCLTRLEADPENSAAADELTATMRTLHAALERRPVLPPLHPALSSGELLPLPQLAQLGVPLYRRRDAGPRVRRGFNVFDLRPRRWA